jgi:Txe/YoeB family toxin of toxin-antitoxin system
LTFFHGSKGVYITIDELEKMECIKLSTLRAIPGRITCTGKCMIKKTLNGYEGIGHTEPLSGDLAGYWSRHIDDSNRLVYRLRDDVIELYELRTHYGDK